MSSEVQYSPSEHDARHEEVAWQVREPPLVSSLQDVKPVTVEQSDITAHITLKGKRVLKITFVVFNIPY